MVAYDTRKERKICLQNAQNSKKHIEYLKGTLRNTLFKGCNITGAGDKKFREITNNSERYCGESSFTDLKTITRVWF